LSKYTVTISVFVLKAPYSPPWNRVEYYSSAGGSWRIAATDLEIPEFTLVNLKPQSSYGVIVRALNSNGVSEPSGIAEVNTR